MAFQPSFSCYIYACISSRHMYTYIHTDGDAISGISAPFYGTYIHTYIHTYIIQMVTLFLASVHLFVVSVSNLALVYNQIILCVSIG